jgi:hypothetical protein
MWEMRVVLEIQGIDHADDVDCVWVCHLKCRICAKTTCLSGTSLLTCRRQAAAQAAAVLVQNNLFI